MEKPMKIYDMFVFSRKFTVLANTEYKAREYIIDYYSKKQPSITVRVRDIQLIDCHPVKAGVVNDSGDLTD
jgi:hypothetical protein